MSIETYGFHPGLQPEIQAGIPARITAVHRDRFEIVCDQGFGHARLKAASYRAGGECLPTAGDFVLLDRQEHGDSLIIKTLPRRTVFSRLDPSSSGREEQAVAANFDYVFILQPLVPEPNPRQLERYLTLAWQSGAVPAVLLTKADAGPADAAVLREAEKLAAGTGVFAVSAHTGEGLDSLGTYLKPGKTIVFLGPSGVGKSSLINALAGQEVMATGPVRKKDGRGRHTTTHRQLLRLDSGVLVIDTPGMRELGMWDVRDGLGPSFADVENILGNCKFRDCRHQSEPGCAVTDAIRRGELSQERWESYLRLRAEARYADDKAAYQREKQQWRKDIVKMQRQTRLPDYQHDPCPESFTCKVCGTVVVPEEAGSQHRNHCPQCLSSLHVDNKPGDRASLCRGIMDPIGVWVRKNGEWAVIHRCRSCGVLHSNRIAAYDTPSLLMSIAMKPLAEPPFPLWSCGGLSAGTSPNPSTPSGTRR